jgi:hypothetical protein
MRGFHWLCAALRTEADFIVPDWGDKVDSGLGFSYRPISLHKPMDTICTKPESTISPHLGTMNLATACNNRNNLDFSEQYLSKFS